MSVKSSEERMERVFVSLFGFVMLTMLNFLHALFLMLGSDVAHKHWASVPALGYWESFLLLCAIGSVAGSIHGGMRVKHKSS